MRLHVTSLTCISTHRHMFVSVNLLFQTVFSEIHVDSLPLVLAFSFSISLSHSILSVHMALEGRGWRLVGFKD
jgi:hypothetical protein